jgi:transposase
MQWRIFLRGNSWRKSDTTVAVRYALTLRETLVRYCNDGRLEIDNSAAERALRAVALGRKNHLFAGSDAGGSRHCHGIILSHGIILTNNATCTAEGTNGHW